MAMDNLTGTAAVRLRLTGTKTLALGNLTRELNITKELAIALGTGALQANNFYEGQRTLTTGAAESLDFAGSLLNAYGDAVVLSEIKGLYIYNSHASQVLTVGAANNIPPLPTAGIPIRPGGVLFIVAPDAAGYAVTAGTGDLITLTNAAGTSLIYDIVVWGN